MNNFLRNKELYSNQWEVSKSLYVKEVFDMIKKKSKN